MTTATDAALDWYQNRSIGNSSAVVDTIAVGSGTGSESSTSSGLSSEEYRASTSDQNVEITKTANLGEVDVTIEVTGGTEVAAGTEISEMMAYISAENIVVAVDNFSGVTVGAGETEQFSFPLVIERGN